MPADRLPLSRLPGLLRELEASLEGADELHKTILYLTPRPSNALEDAALAAILHRLDGGVAGIALVRDQARHWADEVKTGKQQSQLERAWIVANKLEPYLEAIHLATERLKQRGNTPSGGPFVERDITHLSVLSELVTMCLDDARAILDGMVAAEGQLGGLDSTMRAHLAEVVLRQKEDAVALLAIPAY
jgi:hypothetical protein